MPPRKPTKAVIAEPSKKARISQADVPGYSLVQALRVSKAIAESLGLRGSRPLLVAQAMGVQPTSGIFRGLCGASIAYGLTDGGYGADIISLTPLGRRIVAPTLDGDDAIACREAVLKPKILREFLERYDGARVPREEIARNVIVELGVPREAASRVFDLIVESARTVGFLRDVNGVSYVDLLNTSATSPSTLQPQSADTPTDEDDNEISEIQNDSATIPPVRAVDAQLRKQRVFISHGRNMGIVEQVKTMLNVAEVEYEIAVEGETTAIPVPEKVFDSMRRCTAAIICVTADGDDSDQVPELNKNVLIEIGAAFVLYDRRVILLWDKRVSVPSNLQGLYRCQFQGNELSWADGMKLMEVIKKFRGPTS